MESSYPESGTGSDSTPTKDKRKVCSDNIVREIDSILKNEVPVPVVKTLVIIKNTLNQIEKAETVYDELSLCLRLLKGSFNLKAIPDLEASIKELIKKIEKGMNECLTINTTKNFLQAPPNRVSPLFHR